MASTALSAASNAAMATLEDVRSTASKLPGATEGEGPHFAFGVTVKGKHKGFVWSWAERVDPKKARIPNPHVLAVLVPSLEVKEMLLASDRHKFFTEPHYNGFPAVLVRLDEISAEELAEMIVEAYRCKASAELVRQLDSDTTELR